MSEDQKMLDTRTLTLEEELESVGVFTREEPVKIGIAIANDLALLTAETPELHLHLRYQLNGDQPVYGWHAGTVKLAEHYDDAGRVIIEQRGYACQKLKNEVVGPLAKLLNKHGVRDYEISLEAPLTTQNYKLFFEPGEEGQQVLVRRVKGGKIKYVEPGMKPDSGMTGRYHFKA